MAIAMMNQILLTAIMMVAIVVEYAATKTIVLNVCATLKQKRTQVFLVIIFKILKQNSPVLNPNWHDLRKQGKCLHDS